MKNSILVLMMVDMLEIVLYYNVSYGQILRKSNCAHITTVQTVLYCNTNLGTHNNFNSILLHILHVWVNSHATDTQTYNCKYAQFMLNKGTHICPCNVGCIFNNASSPFLSAEKRVLRLHTVESQASLWGQLPVWGIDKIVMTDQWFIKPVDDQSIIDHRSYSRCKINIINMTVSICISQVL